MKERKEIRKMRQLIKSKVKEIENPQTCKELEEFISPENDSDNKLKKLSMHPYGDDLL